MANKLNYNYIKNAIENDSDSGCLLISQEYNNALQKLELKCKCGNNFLCKLE